MAPNKPAKNRARPAGPAKQPAQASGGAEPLRLSAELRISSAASLFESLAAAAQRPVSDVVLDASQVEKADTAGVQALVAGTMRLKQSGKSFRWSGCSAPLRSAAQLLGLADALELPS